MTSLTKAQLAGFTTVRGIVRALGQHVGVTNDKIELSVGEQRYNPASFYITGAFGANGIQNVCVYLELARGGRAKNNRTLWESLTHSIDVENAKLVFVDEQNYELKVTECHIDGEGAHVILDYA